MNPERKITPLDKDALVLLPGLRYARDLIDLSMQVSRHSALGGRMHQSQRQRPPKKN